MRDRETSGWRCLAREEGYAAVEYPLILLLICIPFVLAVVAGDLGGEIADVVSRITAAI